MIFATKTQRKEYELEKLNEMIIPESFWDNWNTTKFEIRSSVTNEPIAVEQVKIEPEPEPEPIEDTSRDEDTDFSLKFNKCSRCGSISVNRICDNCL
jgi:hypothetical protein